MPQERGFEKAQESLLSRVGRCQSGLYWFTFLGAANRAVYWYNSPSIDGHNNWALQVDILLLLCPPILWASLAIPKIVIEKEMWSVEMKLMRRKTMLAKLRKKRGIECNCLLSHSPKWHKRKWQILKWSKRYFDCLEDAREWYFPPFPDVCGTFQFENLIGNCKHDNDRPLVSLL